MGKPVSIIVTKCVNGYIATKWKGDNAKYSSDEMMVFVDWEEVDDYLYSHFEGELTDEVA